MSLFLCLTKLFEHKKVFRNVACEALRGTYEMLRRLFLQRATADFPKCAWFNRPYAYLVRMISLFIAILFIMSSACLAAACLWLRFNSEAEVQTATGDGKLLSWVTIHLKRTDAACVCVCVCIRDTEIWIFSMFWSTMCPWEKASR